MGVSAKAKWRLEAYPPLSTSQARPGCGWRWVLASASSQGLHLDRVSCSVADRRPDSIMLMDRSNHRDRSKAQQASLTRDALTNLEGGSASPALASSLLPRVSAFAGFVQSTGGTTTTRRSHANPESSSRSPRARASDRIRRACQAVAAPWRERERGEGDDG